jgi:hypothetical protein
MPLYPAPRALSFTFLLPLSVSISVIRIGTVIYLPLTRFPIPAEKKWNLSFRQNVHIDSRAQPASISRVIYVVRAAGVRSWPLIPILVPLLVVVEAKPAFPLCAFTMCTWCIAVPAVFILSSGRLASSYSEESWTTETNAACSFPRERLYRIKSEQSVMQHEDVEKIYTSVRYSLCVVLR